jgi:hypothetical protein
MGEYNSEVQEALTQARSAFEGEWSQSSDKTGARLVAAAITLAGARIAFQLMRLMK